MSLEDEITLVLDTGSKITKAGFAGEHFPRAVFPTAVGRFRHQGLIDGFPDVCIGHEAIKKRGLINLTWPVQDGLIKTWDEIEKLWFHIFFKGLHVPPEKCRILYAVHPLIPKGDRERMAEILFESFAINGLNLVKAPILTLHASGRTTGIVYENGASSSYVCPVFEGFPLVHTTASCELTGQALSNRLGEMLKGLGYHFTTAFEKSLLEDVKAKLCYVARNYKEECEKYAASGENQDKYELPDGQHILLGEERFQCAEVLFQPSLAGLNCPSIVDCISQSAQKCDIDIRNKLYENIVISGGSTQFPGFGNRLLHELVSRLKILPADATKKVFIDELPARQAASWIGGSILASLDSLKGFWMTKEEYADVGVDRVNYKFF